MAFVLSRPSLKKGAGARLASAGGLALAIFAVSHGRAGPSIQHIILLESGLHRHPSDDGLVDAEIAAFDGFWQCQPQHGVSRAPMPVATARRAPEMLISLSSRRTSPMVCSELMTIERLTLSM
jgi:hypothetical protein